MSGGGRLDSGGREFAARSYLPGAKPRLQVLLADCADGVRIWTWLISTNGPCWRSPPTESSPPQGFELDGVGGRCQLVTGHNGKHMCSRRPASQAQRAGECSRRSGGPNRCRAALPSARLRKRALDASCGGSAADRRHARRMTSCFRGTGPNGCALFGDPPRAL